MRIAIAKPDWGITGGFELLLEQLAARLQHEGHTIHWELQRVDELGSHAFGMDVSALKQRVPDFVRFTQLIERFFHLDVGYADLVVSAMPGAYSVQHERHIAVFSHHLRSFYDLSNVLIEAGMIPDVEAHLRCAEHVRHVDARYLGAVPLILATSPEVASRLSSFNRLVHNVDLLLAGIGFHDEFPEPSSQDRFEHVLCVSRHEFPKRNELFVQALHSVDKLRGISVGAGGRLGWAMKLDQDFALGDRDPTQASRGLWCTDAPWLDPKDFPSEGRVSFLGHVSNKDLDRLYRHALCVVAPAYLEDYGLTAIEAMAYGKPLIVCSDGGNLVNFVKDGHNGFVVEPDGKAIATAISKLRDDPSLARQMGAAAREVASQYTWERAMVQFTDGIERVMSE